VEVVVVQAVSTVLMTLSIREEKKRLRSNFFLFLRLIMEPWCVYTGAIFFVKNVGFTNEK
jgi:hypothetical protein